MEGQRFFSSLLRRLFLKTARTFAGQMLEFDHAVGRHGGLVGASLSVLEKRYVRSFHVDGQEHVPSHGPALFVSNHPGMADTISLFAAIGRPDLKVVAVRRPFLESLENTAKHIFFVEENLGKRVITAHEIAAHLRQGGAVLTFPAGRIEPDPDLHRDALDSVNDWVDSARVVCRFAPETTIIPVLVRGVIWKKTTQHWLTRLKRTRLEQEKLAAALQLIAMVSGGIRPTSVTLGFAAPISLTQHDFVQCEAIRDIVADRMRQLISLAIEASRTPSPAV